MTKIRLATIHRQYRKLSLAISLLCLTAIMTIWLTPDRQKNLPIVKSAEWVPIQPQAIEQQLGLVGRIEASKQITISAPFEGVIQNVQVSEGESVKAGQMLVQMDPELILIRLRQAQAELIKAKQDVHQLDVWDSSPDVSRARRAEQAARSALTTTQANLRDTQTLFKRGIVARMEVDALLQQKMIQTQELLSAQEDLRNARARGTGEEQKIAEMALMNAQARYLALKAQLDKQLIVAPFNGIAVRPDTNEAAKTVFAQSGQQVSQGSPLISIISLEQLQVSTQVTESDLHMLHEGLAVKVTGDGFAGLVLEGHITGISVQSDTPDSIGSAARYNVVASLDNLPSITHQPIRLGMSARVAVILYKKENAIVIPPEAIHEDDGKAWVWYRTGTDAQAIQQQVTTERSVPQGIEVKGIGAGYVNVKN